MIRRLFTAASVLSLLLSVVAAGLWLRSYLNGPDFLLAVDRPRLIPKYSTFTEGAYYIVTIDGRMVLGYDRGEYWYSGGPAGRRFFWSGRAGGFNHWLRTEYLGFPGKQRANPWSFDDRDGHHAGINIFGWIPPFLFSLPAVMWLFRWRRTRRITRFGNHLCVVCGYDVRASKERCPECGTMIQVKARPGA